MTTNNSNENKKECEGCYIRDSCKLDTSYIDPETNETIICPCRNCIIKMMCKGYSSMCKEYAEYLKVVKTM